ncbi:putative amino acid transporter [Sphingomonas changbaiensis NBRC 104936]|uniref:Putative amino acid transporter n=1 Tax=Sphingomonas changbaiensis NBRC 104936 TaxID=1219043 RepID=A0A0E9ML09_9SPHN|nr:LysE family translocator [Sphingomonas changbaiensis]GAO38452.1 putative amino acid transporter [Sphingomonas changbaiensis NBRC 104936]
MIALAGYELLPDWPRFAAFAAAGLALNVVPGADMTFVIAAGARGGRRAGAIAALGIGAGTLGHIVAAVLGLSALLMSSQALFEALKLVGAAYLLYVAVGLLRAPKPEAKAVAAPARLFRTAALINLTNPKVALFFLAFLPQFVDPAAQAPALQILCLGLWFDLVGTLVNAVIGVGAAGTAVRLGRIPWFGRAARWCAATLLGGLAIQLALAERR